MKRQIKQLLNEPLLHFLESAPAGKIAKQ